MSVRSGSVGRVSVVRSAVTRGAVRSDSGVRRTSHSHTPHSHWHGGGWIKVSRCTVVPFKILGINTCQHFKKILCDEVIVGSISKC